MLLKIEAHRCVEAKYTVKKFLYKYQNFGSQFFILLGLQEI